MKTILFILLCIFGWFVHKPFTVVEKTVQTSMGGRAESGIATSYTVKFVANYSSEKMSIGDMWIDSVYFEVHPYKQNADLSFSQKWEKGDTLFVKVVKHRYPDGIKIVKDNSGPVKPLPRKYSGAALIGYKLKGKMKFFVIDEFKELSTLYMP
jgi:hypothetical protein